VYPSQIEAVLIGRPRIAPHYLIVVERTGNLDHVTLEVEANVGVSEADFVWIAGDVAHHVKSLVGITVTTVIRKPGEIPRSQGKAVRVRDLRQQGS
jgi:phenylacetate-CoA ligase